MVFRPGASEEAGMQTPVFRAASNARRALWATAALLCLVAPMAHAADPAQDVMRKMGDVYRNAKSFSGSVAIRQNLKGPDGKPVSVTTDQQIKYKSPNLFAVVMNVHVKQGSGNRAVSQTIISDGKTLYNWMPAMKQYAKHPAPPAVTFPVLLVNLKLAVVPDPTKPVDGARLVSPTTVQGHSAYVVEIVPTKLPANLPAAQKALAKIPVRLVIDKQNYHLLRVSKSGGGASLEIVFGPQTFNSSIASSAFHFHPPAGAKEAPPMPTMPGGTPPGAGAIPPGRHR
jgi:outer membrane lipoprotein-sorting protein